VLNASGDSGSTCLDGTANTVGVPADSPNATAVGGSSLTLATGNIYGSETWWNGISDTPPTGQGGFGVTISQFFSRPSYQNGLSMAAGRSVPDVVVNADPKSGVVICEADAGGCPTGLIYNGTSNAAPIWAAITAHLNQALGSAIGSLNTVLYPLANTKAFHSPSSMSPVSDFQHVGLGSPNVDKILLALNHQSVGSVSASLSQVMPVPFGPKVPDFVPADGTSHAVVVAKLFDANGNYVSGKTVTLAVGGGSSAKISPASAVSDPNNGAAAFTVTDLMPEAVTLTATGDGITLSQTAAVTFTVPPATSAGIGGGPSSVAANGTDNATIVVTLKDSLGRGTPGKIVTLEQGNSQSVITGPIPAVTDSNGQIQFATTDVHTENIIYTATDVTDGNLPVPGSVSVDFTSGIGGCSGGTPTAGPGYGVSTVASGPGFVAKAFYFGNVNVGCIGAYGLAFDPSGNLYVADDPTGNVYKFSSMGGIADSGTLLTSTPLGPGTTGLAFDKSGHLFASRLATTGDFTTGDVIQVNPSTGAIIREVASGLVCPYTLATDPISGDLFAGDGCTGAGSDRTAIWRISNPGGATPSLSVYANTPGQDNFGISFAPDGALYIISRNFQVARITGTNGPQPPTVSIVPNTIWSGLGIATGGMQANGDAQFLIFNQPASNGEIAAPQTNGRFAVAGITPSVPDSEANTNASSALPAGLQTFDLTATNPAPGVLVATNLYGGDTEVIGPDGCLYAAANVGVYRFTDAAGNCVFQPTALPPALSLSPAVVSPNPVQGTSQTFTATFHHATVPADTPVTLQVSGDNPTVQMARTDANGQASFSYTGKFAGIDNLIATAAVNNAGVASNPAEVTWEPGQDTTFLTLNLSPTNGTPRNPVNLVASLSDVSQNPAVPVVGKSVMLGLGGDTCSALTDVHGNASCQVTPEIIPGSPSRTITASFAGNGNLTSASASAGFMFTAPPEDAKLKVTPKVLHFPERVELGGVGAASRPEMVKVFNPKNRKQKLTVTFLGAENSGDFSIVSGPPTTCNATLAPKARCKIALIFSPTGTGTRTGTLTITDNADINNQQMVKLKGVGRQGKLNYSPALLGFGKQTVNSTSNQKTVKIANRNPLAMTFAAAISGDYTMTNGCSNPLPPKSTCKIQVTFTPTATGARPGALTFTDTAARSPQTVKLTGKGK